MLLHTGPARRRALQICAVGGATLGAMFAFGADSALAAHTAHVQGGTLQITGNGADVLIGGSGDDQGGADTLTVNDLTGTDLTRANIDLSATGGGGDAQADTVIANGTGQADHVRVGTAGNDVQVSGFAAQLQIAGSEPANDRLQINTLGGKDAVTVAPEVSQLILRAVDLGAGQ